MGRLRDKITFWGELNHLYGGNSSRFPLVNHLALYGFESIFVLALGPPLCAHTSFSRDGFQRERPWEVNKTYYGLVPPPLRNLSVHA